MAHLNCTIGGPVGSIYWNAKSILEGGKTKQNPELSLGGKGIESKLCMVNCFQKTLLMQPIVISLSLFQKVSKA